MKNLCLILSILALSVQAFAGSEADVNKAEYQTNNRLVFQNRVGRAIFKHSERVLKCTYDFSVLGGAVAAGGVNLRNEDGKDCIVPKNSIIEQVLIDVITAGTTSASGTMALQAQSANDLHTALAAASYTGIVAGVPVGTAATAIKMTADRTVKGVIATGALTAGKWNVLIRYSMSQ